MAEPFTAYLLAFVTGGLVIYVELATQYSRTQKFALGNFVVFSYFVLHAALSAILFHIIVSVQELDRVDRVIDRVRHNDLDNLCWLHEHHRIAS